MTTDQRDHARRARAARQRQFIVSLLLVAIGLAIGLPPLALWGPGAALAVPGALLLIFALISPEVVP